MPLVWPFTKEYPKWMNLSTFKYFRNVTLGDTHVINESHRQKATCNRLRSIVTISQKLYPSFPCVLYSKDVYPTSSIEWSTTFPFIVLTKQYHIYIQCFLKKTFLIIWLIYIYVHYYVLIYYYNYHILRSLYNVLLNIVPASFYVNHTTSPYLYLFCIRLNVFPQWAWNM